MKKLCLRLIALLLIAALLPGCDLEALREDAFSYLRRAVGPEGTPFSEMTYTRPDMERLEQSAQTAREAATGLSLDSILDKIYAFYDEYNSFYTNYILANIHYCHDLTDTYWESEYSFCREQTAIADTALEDLYYALADSPCRSQLEDPNYFGPDFFDSYEGESPWDQALVDLLTQENQLQARYYTLISQAEEYDTASRDFYDQLGGEMASLLAELIGIRQQIAQELGYDSYVQYAWDSRHTRDYSPGKTQRYLEQIRRELVPLFRQAAQKDYWGLVEPTTSQQTFAFVQAAAQRLGGECADAFSLMESAKLYDIEPGENKYSTSFSVYLPDYRQPFIFLSPLSETYDHLTFAHEFGHFCNDYATEGNYGGTDVLEFFSQGMEYLALSSPDADQDLVRVKMADSLFVYVEQAAYTSFEMQMYQLTGDDLTAENLMALYDRTAREFGFDAYGYEPWGFVQITHIYDDPMYLISYVVSNDAAMQLYQMEQDAPGSGAALYLDHLDADDAYLLTFLNKAGLQSPFDRDRIEKVRDTFLAILD